MAISESNDHTWAFIFCTLKKKKKWKERASQLNYTSLTMGPFIHIHNLFDEKIGMQQVYNSNRLLKKLNIEMYVHKLIKF